MDERFFWRRTVAVGVDLGQSQDPTSIAVIEKIAPEVPADLPRAFVPARLEQMADVPARYNLRLLEQAPLGESYPAQAQRLNAIIGRPSIAEHDPRVWLDFTGIGRPIYEIFKQERVPRIVPVTITFGGQEGPNGRGGHNVPKLALVSRLQALMHTGRLSMPELPLAKTFRRELMDFRVSYSAVGNATFGAREGAHDDLILAVALGVYGLDSVRVVTVEPLRV